VSVRLPPLNALKAFEAVSRAGNFTLAGRAMNVSQGAISRHIAQLEAHLNVELFSRQKRAVTLTPEGQAYAKVIQRAFKEIEQASDTLTESQKGTQLRAVLFPSFVGRWLMSRLWRFGVAHPTIDLRLTTSSKPANLLEREADITNLNSFDSHDEIESIPLIDIELRPVCSPKLLARKRLKTHDLLDYTLIRSLNRPDDWELWLRHVDPSLPKPRRFIDVENSMLACQAALDGLGVAMLVTPAFAENDIARHRLTFPFREKLKTGQAYRLGWLKSNANREAVKAFREWTMSEISLSSRTPIWAPAKGQVGSSSNR
jgi:LysR family transcriptional regulator, glycine cleavage system transcriptional activator